jgi:nucleoside-diphosphate-sugar epimerase
MRILIIGGTGFIGPQVVVSLMEKGHDVTLFHRGETEVEFPREPRHICGNRHYLADYRAEFEDLCPEVILDMFALSERDTRAVLVVFKGIAARLVTVSSQDVYRAYGNVIRTESGPVEPVPINEGASLRTKLYPYRDEIPRKKDDPHRYLDDYDKIPVEKATMSEPDLPGTVLRLPMVYGQRDNQHRLFNYLRRMDDSRPAIILDDGIASWRTTRGYVENVGAAISLAVTDERATGRIYNVGESEAYSMAEWVKKIGEAAEWAGDIAIVPRESLPPELIADVNTDQDLVVDTARVREELGYEEPVSTEVALARTVAWQRQHPPATIDPHTFDYATEDAILATLKP